jgi:addiction module RelE/StbE family toxin
MVQIKWTPQAVQDLEDIHEFIAKDSVKYAVRQISLIRKRTQILKYQTAAGKKVDEFKSENIRELIEGNYRIIYRQVDLYRIDILTVHHAARDLIRRNVK